MTNKKGPSNVAIALITLAAMTSAVACSSDDKNDTAGAGSSGMAGSGASGSGVGDDSMAGASSGTSTGNNNDPVDYTTCSPMECDAKAKLDFDFSGKWDESLVFTSNDCDPSLQPLLPPGFAMKGAIFTDVIVGNCFRQTPESEEYTGIIATDLSEAEYCAISKQAVGAPVGDVDLVSHVKWTSIETNLISGKSSVYVAQAGCTLVGDYTLTRAEE